jgi:hypothetical protein
VVLPGSTKQFTVSKERRSLIMVHSIDVFLKVSTTAAPETMTRSDRQSGNCQDNLRVYYVYSPSTKCEGNNLEHMTT